MQKIILAILLLTNISFAEGPATGINPMDALRGVGDAPRNNNQCQKCNEDDSRETRSYIRDINKCVSDLCGKSSDVKDIWTRIKKFKKDKNNYMDQIFNKEFDRDVGEILDLSKRKYQKTSNNLSLTKIGPMRFNPKAIGAAGKLGLDLLKAAKSLEEIHKLVGSGYDEKGYVPQGVKIAVNDNDKRRFYIYSMDEEAFMSKLTENEQKAISYEEKLKEFTNKKLSDKELEVISRQAIIPFYSKRFDRELAQVMIEHGGKIPTGVYGKLWNGYYEEAKKNPKKLKKYVELHLKGEIKAYKKVQEEKVDRHGRGVLEELYKKNKDSILVGKMLDEYPLQTVIQEVYGKSDWKAKLKEITEQYVENIKYMEEKYGEKVPNWGELFQMPNIDDVDSILNLQGALSERADQEIFLKLLKANSLMGALKLGHDPESAFSQFKSKKALKNVLKDKNFSGQRDALMRMDDNCPKLEDQYLNYCRARRDAFISYLPSEKELKKLRAGVKRQKGQILDKMRENGSISNNTSVILKDVISQYKILYPPSREIYKNEMSKQLKKYKNDLKESITHLESPKKKQFETLKTLVNEMDYLNFQGDVTFSCGEHRSNNDFELNLKKICDFDLKEERGKKWRATPYTLELSDQCSPLRNTSIQLSGLFTKITDFGINSFAHEFGHVVDRALDTNQEKVSTESKEKMKKIRRCVIDNHKLLDPNYMDPNQEWQGSGRPEDYYLSEDFGDMVASGYGVGINRMCLVLPQKNSTYDIKGPNQMDWFRTYQQQFSDDTHSSLFFRALQGHYYRHKNFPASCKRLFKGLDNMKDCSALKE